MYIEIQIPTFNIHTEKVTLSLTFAAKKNLSKDIRLIFCSQDARFVYKSVISLPQMKAERMEKVRSWKALQTINLL